MALTHNSETELQNRGAEEEEVRLDASPCVKYRHKSHIKMKLKYSSKQETFGAEERCYSLAVSTVGRWLKACWVKEGIKQSNGKSN